MDYREQLLAAGFCEAKHKAQRFFRYEQENTAFIINLEEDEYGTTVLYGFTAVSAMAGEEDWLALHGEDDNTCTLRQTLFIASPEDEQEARTRITAFYREYCHCKKDELRSLKKERQKQFLQRFATALKPLGFKKKAAVWTKPLEGGYVLVLEAQKSAYSDQYYFNVAIRRGDYAQLHYKECFRNRLIRGGREIFDWQLMSAAQTDALIEDLLQRMINPILSLPLPELGKQAFIHKGCACDRARCAPCWVAHNLWRG